MELSGGVRRQTGGKEAYRRLRRWSGTMCNNYRLHVPANQLAAPFTDIGRTLAQPDGVPNLEPTDYRIGDRAPVVLAGEGGLQLVMTPWAWKGPTGKPVFNFRSEGRSFDGSTRCLIPADGFYVKPPKRLSMKISRSGCGSFRMSCFRRTVSVWDAASVEGGVVAAWRRCL